MSLTGQQTASDLFLMCQVFSWIGERLLSTGYN